MTTLIDSYLDPATLRNIKLEPKQITLNFQDGGTINIFANELGTAELYVESKSSNES
jgi:hypothetical protein